MEESLLRAQPVPAFSATEFSPSSVRASAQNVGWLRSRAAVVLGVLLLTSAALVLRFIGIGFILPHMLEPDGGVILHQVLLMHSDHPNPESMPNWSAYPHLTARFIALWPDARNKPLLSNDLVGHLTQASAPLRNARIGVAILSVLLVPGTWLLARRFLSRGAAFFAATMMSTSLLAVFFAQQCRPHGPAAAMCLFAVLAAMRLRDRPSVASYVLAGVAAGAAIGTLQSSAAVLIPLGAAHWMRRRERPCAGRWYILIALAIAAATSLAFYPFLLKPTLATDTPTLRIADQTLEFFGHRIFLDLFNGAGFAIELATVWSFETVASVLALLGLGLWLFDGERKFARAYWRARPDLVIALSYVLPYFIVVGMYERTYERFVLQHLPYVMVLATFGAVRSVRLLASRAVPKVVIGTAGAALLAVPAFGTARLVHLRALPDAGTMVARWIEAHVQPKEERVLIVPFVDIPLWRTEDALADEAHLGWTSPWQVYQAQLVGLAVEGERYDLRYWPITNPGARELALEDPIAYCKTVEARYVIVGVPQLRTQDLVRQQFRKALLEGTELLLRVPSSAQGFDGEPTLLHEDLPDRNPWNWTLNMLHEFSAAGLVIEVYKVP